MAAPAIAVVGEALVDLVPSLLAPAPPGEPAQLLARPGGSPANVAVGLARLEVPAAFVGRLSRSGFGPMLREHLLANGVDLSMSVTAAENATVALVALDAFGVPAYTFYGPDTADWQWRPSELPDPRALQARAVHSGSLALALAPGREVLAGWLARVREQGRALVSLDPNVRPGFIGDLDRFRAAFQALLPVAHLVKVSDEDLRVLHPDEDPLGAARRWARSGPELVLVTHGPEGASAILADGTELRRPAVPAVLVDTVGAGDAFMAGLLARLHEIGLLAPAALSGVAVEQLAAAMDRAALVASITCSRAGADPPRRAELPAI